MGGSDAANQSVSSSVYSPLPSGVQRPDSSVERVALSGELSNSEGWLAQVPGSTPGRVLASHFLCTLKECSTLRLRHQGWADDIAGCQGQLRFGAGLAFQHDQISEGSAVRSFVILWCDGFPMLRIAVFKHACMGLKIRGPHDLVKVEWWILPNLAICLLYTSDAADDLTTV